MYSTNSLYISYTVCITNVLIHCPYVCTYIHTFMLLFNFSVSMARSDMERPKQILFIEELTGLITENLPDLWNLGCAYMSKSLYQDIVSVCVCVCVCVCMHVCMFASRYLCE